MTIYLWMLLRAALVVTSAIAAVIVLTVIVPIVAWFLAPIFEVLGAGVCVIAFAGMLLAYRWAHDPREAAGLMLGILAALALVSSGLYVIAFVARLP